MYSSCFEISVTQHDVLRDLALNLSNRASINERRRLVMPKREKGLPKEWLRHKHRPFEAQIVSIHTSMYLCEYTLHMHARACVLYIHFFLASNVIHVYDEFYNFTLQVK